MRTKEEIRAYMRKYYQKHKEERHLEYVVWCKDHPNQNRAERGRENRTPEEIKKYHRDYYQSRKQKFSENHQAWRETYPERYKEGQRSWERRNPTYHINYTQTRLAIVDPLIFQFLDGGGVGTDTEEYIAYLRGHNVSEQHINWFKTDLRKCLNGENEHRTREIVI